GAFDRERPSGDTVAGHARPDVQRRVGRDRGPDRARHEPGHGDLRLRLRPRLRPPADRRGSGRGALRPDGHRRLPGEGGAAGMNPAPAPLLAVSGLCSGYGPVQVLYGVDIAVQRGEVVALLGPNGAGKTTLLRTIAGQIRPMAGTVTVDGRPVGGQAPERVVAAGVVLVDEGRQVFPTL